MKSTQNKLTSLLGGIAIVFAMMLFLPSTASATWGNYHNSCSSYKHASHTSKKHGSKKHGSHGSKKHGTHGSKKHGSHGSYKHGSHKHGSHGSCTTDCSKYEKLAAKYKELAAQYLAKYNSTHCYSYYKYYLCYAKKYDYYKKKLEQCKPAEVDCDKYKIIADQYKVKAEQYKACADKYLAAYYRCHYYYYYYYYACYMKKYNYYMGFYTQYMEKYNNCQAQNSYGKVHGYVYEDTDGDKQKNAGEHGVAGIIVILTDEDGQEYSTATDATGRYEFVKVVKGVATVTVTENGLPDNATLYEENNPATITVKVAKDSGVVDIGYVLPEPTGSLSGKVFEDADENGDFTDGELGAADIVVTISDKEGESQSLITTDGTYHFDQVIQGHVDIVVSHLPTGADVTIGSLSFSKSVIAGQDNIATDVGYLLPVPTGILVGKVFEDADEDGSFTAGEIGAHGITISVTDSEGNIKSVVSTDGTYRFVDVVEGDVDIAVTGLPADATVTIGGLSFPASITAGEENVAEDVGYILPTPVGTLSGRVFEDVDGNDVYTAGEVGASGITITIVDSDGTTQEIVSVNGTYQFDNVAEGSVDITVSALPVNFVLVAGSALGFSATVEAGQNTVATDVAYVVPAVTGSIYGTVYEDSDDNKVQNNNEIGAAGITITILDADNVLHTATTNDVGYYTIDNIAVGVAVVSLVISSLPSGMEHSVGNIVDFVTVVENSSSDAGKDGYTEVSWAP